METKKSLLVPRAGMFDFNYEFDPANLIKENCNNEPVCYHGLYDLQITITDDWNNQKLGGAAFDTIIRNYSIDAIDTTCQDAAPFRFSFSLFLPEGNYEITKKLSVSSYALEYYRDNVFLKNNTCKTLEQFIEEQRLLFRDGQCQPDCQSCMEEIGSWDIFFENYLRDAGISLGDSAVYREEALMVFQQTLAACSALCETESETDDIRRAMLLDMTSPSGQYANPDNAQDKYSIFYIPPGEPTETVYAPYMNSALIYRDESGNTDRVFNDYTWSYGTPQKLDANQFSQKFKASWAEALLPLHPEYCKLLEFEKHTASNLWDRRFQKVDTYAEAEALGYLNPTAIPALRYAIPADVDPLSMEKGGAYRTELNNRISAYTGSSQGSLSLWAMANLITKCDKEDNSCMTYYKDDAHAFDTNLMCAADLDMAWRSFREMYLNIKRDLGKQAGE